MKKKLIFLLVCILSLGLFSGCGMEKTVPDKTIEWIVEDYLEILQQTAGKPIDYSYNVSHDSDKATRTDTVTISLLVACERLSGHADYECTFQYDKSSEKWEKLRGKEWGAFSVETYAIDNSAQVWKASAERRFSNASLYNNSDYAPSAILLQLDDWGKKVKTEWSLHATDGENHSRWFSVYACELGDIDSASRFLDASRLYNRTNDFYYWKWEELDYQEGEDFAFVKGKVIYDTDAEETWLMLRVDRWLYFVTSGWYDTEWDMYSVLTDLGFIS